MKKLKLLVIVMFAILMIPVGVFADENEEVNVYFFKGDGCGYCEAGLEWFDEIEDRYGERYKLHEYETWYDKDNAALMEAVAKIRGEDVQGVPYIIIGDQSWNGFDDSYKDEIIDKIRSEYKTAVAERYDVMNYVKPKINTIGIGLCASMGAFLLSSGAKNKRYALENTKVMIHQPLGGAKGQATDIMIVAEEIVRIKKQLNNILSKNTGQDIKKITLDTERDFYMTSTEAINYGLIDEILTSQETILDK